MPTNYTGNPAAVESPATAPAFNNPVVVALPIDSEGGAASLYQPFKVLADNTTLALSALGGTALTAGGITAPTPTFNRGWLYKESVPFAVCICDGAGFVGGMNIASFSRTSTGIYAVGLSVAASSLSRLAIVSGANGGFTSVAASSTSSIGVGSYQISTSGPTITLANIAWSFVVYHV